jgi:hypothetical protein
LFLFALSTHAGPFEKDFAVVMVNRETEAKYGKMPLDRALFARAIEKLAGGGAKAVVLKFFFDLAREEASDGRLEQAIGILPVALQAAIVEEERNPNVLPERFFVGNLKAETGVSGKSGWIPLPRFSAKARAVGFVNYAPGKELMIETYQGRTVKSLTTCCIELALGRASIFEPGKRVLFGRNELQVDAKNQVAVQFSNTNDLPYISFHAVLDGSAPTNSFAGKVVVIGYTGAEIHSLDTPSGKMDAHKVFLLTLKSVYERVKK